MDELSKIENNLENLEACIIKLTRGFPLSDEDTGEQVDLFYKACESIQESVNKLKKNDIS